ncbi:zinc-binding dehydrogenase [Halomonas sp. HP20-15]|uniref:zinc-binding dehydrogenase n=1 Tax=Halomonas sp. HP20-15 TaxID=3085901 RepID=UPI003992BDEE
MPGSIDCAMARMVLATMRPISLSPSSSACLVIVIVRSLCEANCSPAGARLSEVGRLLDDGSIRVVVDSTYPLADARMAHDISRTRSCSCSNDGGGG